MNCLALHNFQNVEKQQICATSQQDRHWNGKNCVAKVTVPGVPSHKNRTSKKPNDF